MVGLISPPPLSLALLERAVVQSLWEGKSTTESSTMSRGGGRGREEKYKGTPLQGRREGSNSRGSQSHYVGNVCSINFDMQCRNTMTQH